MNKTTKKCTLVQHSLSNCSEMVKLLVKDLLLNMLCRVLVQLPVSDNMTFDISRVLSVLHILPLVRGTLSLFHVELGVELPVAVVNADVTPNTSLKKFLHSSQVPMCSEQSSLETDIADYGDIRSVCWCWQHYSTPVLNKRVCGQSSNVVSEQ